MKRDTRIDVLRALGVLLVIVGHSRVATSVTDTVYTANIAIFFFVSGYLWKDGLPIGETVRKRIKSLYAPWVGWNLAFLALTNAFVAIHIYSRTAASPRGYLTLGQILRQALAIVALRSGELLPGSLWFLVSLLTTTVVFALISMPRREWVRAVAVLACFVIGYFNRLSWPIGVNTSLVGVAVFYAGMLYRRHQARIPLSAPLAALAGVAAFLGRGSVNMSINAYKTPLPGSGPIVPFAVLACGVYAMLWLSSVLGSNRPLAYLGRNTIPVVALHFLAFRLVTWVYVVVHRLPLDSLAAFPVATRPSEGLWWLAYIAVGLGLPLGTVYAWERLARRPTGTPPMEDAPVDRVEPADAA